MKIGKPGSTGNVEIVDNRRWSMGKYGSHNDGNVLERNQLVMGKPELTEQVADIIKWSMGKLVSHNDGNVLERY